MGAGQSKEELLYQAVTNSNHQAVKTLRRDGASLEVCFLLWTDGILGIEMLLESRESLFWWLWIP